MKKFQDDDAGRFDVLLKRHSAGTLTYINDAYQKIIKVKQTPQRNQQTFKQKEEFREAIGDMEVSAPSPMSDSGKKLIKEQKAKAFEY